MPSVTSASWTAKLLARLASPEALWGAGGCAMACASGGFALYMTMVGPAPGNGSHDFPMFASVAARAHRLQPDQAPVATPAVQDEEIDPVVTGSIPSRGDKKQAPAAAILSENPGDSSAGKPILSNVILRQIDGDTALVEINDRLMVYKIGDQIPGAGRFVATSSQNGKPVIETSTGLITETN